MSEPLHLLTVQDAAKQLQISVETIRRACRSGNLTHYRFGSAIRLAPDHLTEYLETQCRAQGLTNPALNSSEANTMSSGGMPGIVGGFRLAQRTRSALNRS